jgi:hypothetical protein
MAWDFFFPDGDVEYIGKINNVNTSKPAWFWQWWYTGEDFGTGFEGGKLEFCKTIDDTDVDSWFELLQYYYNPNNPNISIRTSRL